MDRERNFEYFAKQEGFKIDPERLDFDAYKLHPEEATGPQRDSVRAFGSNDFHVSWAHADPGVVWPRHTHSPGHYQLAIVISGEAIWYYIGNDGSEHSVTVSAGELLYLPPGAHNKIEVVGDEQYTVAIIERENGIQRIEQIVDDPDTVYDPWNDPEWGLWLDTLRGDVHEIDENAVTRW